MMYKRIAQQKRFPKQILLGENYIINFGRNNIHCKFIKCTKLGYNFLNLQTNKCILKQHLYPSKLDKHSSGNWFWINEKMNIIAINE